MPKSKKIEIRAALALLISAARESDNEEEVREITLAIEFGRYPSPGKHLVRSARFGTVVEESENTPFTASVSSETYWCS